MSNTLRLNMPLLDPAQAQKHITINEALVRADILAARRAESRAQSTPPLSPDDSTAYIVGPFAIGDWSGHENDIAIFLNGGWDFVSPWSGAQLWLNDESTFATYVDGVWINGAIAVSSSTANTSATVIEFDHDLAGSAISTTPAIIPDKAIVLGVTGRVSADIIGPTNWSIGVAGSPDRYGSGYGLAVGSFAHGVTGQPQAYFGPTSLEISSDGPAFTTGSVRLAVHCLSLAPPTVG